MRVRRPTLGESKHSSRPSGSGLTGSASGNAGLSHVPEADAIEECEGAEQADSEEEIRPDSASRRSFESAGYTSMAPSTAGTDIEEDAEDEPHRPIDYSAYGSRHKAFEVALKEKTKRFLGLVKMDSILTPSPSGRKIRRHTSRKSLADQECHELDTASRRTSMSSMTSARDYACRSETAAESMPQVCMPSASPVEAQSLHETETCLSLPRHPSMSTAAPSPRLPLVRRFSGMKRTISGRSVKMDGDGDCDENSGEGFDDSVDNREGVYDSSKKQRVPSWVSEIVVIGLTSASATGCSGRHISTQTRFRETSSHLPILDTDLSIASRMPLPTLEAICVSRWPGPAPSNLLVSIGSAWIATCHQRLLRTLRHTLRTKLPIHLSNLPRLRMWIVPTRRCHSIILVVSFPGQSDQARDRLTMCPRGFVPERGHFRARIIRSSTSPRSKRVRPHTQE